MALQLCVLKSAQEPGWESRNGSVREQVPKKRLFTAAEACQPLACLLGLWRNTGNSVLGICGYGLDVP